MTATPRRVESRIVAGPGYRSHEAAIKLAEIADLHEQLAQAASGLTPAQFAWQGAPGRNTIGMLLAHIAVAEVHVTDVVLRGQRDSDIAGVLGITMDDDGIPLPPEGRPPGALAGRGWAFFDDLLTRALAHARTHGQGLEDAMLGLAIERPPRPDGTVRVFDRRWGLHHLVEHAAQHLGQIHLLKALMPRDV